MAYIRKSEIKKKANEAAKAARAKEEAEICFSCKLPPNSCHSEGTTCHFAKNNKAVFFVQEYSGFGEIATDDEVISEKDLRIATAAAERNGIAKRKLTRSQRSR